MFARPVSIAVVVFIGALVVLAACTGGNGGEVDGRLKVVTTVSPITSLVENIGGTKINLKGVIPEGVNSHTFEPPPSVVRTLTEADLIILNGLRLEEPTLELADANKKEDAAILLLGDNTITPEEYKFDFSFPKEEGKPNPHLWPNPELTMDYARLIHEQLFALDPANADYYQANFEELTRRLQILDERMRTAVQSIPEENRKLLTYHDSWAYWAERYGMTVIGAIQPSNFAEPSAREVAGLIDQIREQQVPTIFGSEVFSSPVLEQIASESGAEYVDDLRDDDLPGEAGDPLHSYIGLMVQNMRVMVPALGGDASSMDDVDTSLVFSDGASTAVYPQ